MSSKKAMKQAQNKLMQNTEVALQIVVGLILKTKVLQKKIKRKINFLF